MRLLFVLPGLFVSVLCCVLWSGKAYAQVQQPALQSSADLSNKENQLFCEIDPHSEAWSGSGLKLKPTLGLNPKRVSTENQLQPVYIDTDSLKGRTDLEVTLDGSVKLRRGSTLIKAERIEYFQPADQAKANGSVYMNLGGNIFTGTLLDLKMDAMDGYMQDPVFFFNKGNGQGSAEKMQFIDDKKTVAEKVKYTSCKRKPGPDWMPDWFMKADQISFDQDQNEAVAKNAQLLFYGVPILASPALSFPLSSERKSGFLAPTFFIDNLGGIEMSLPYYVNLAPNRDYTITTTPMSQRGVLFSNEFRYLERKVPQQPFEGTALFEYMPVDELRESERWGLSFQHNGWADEKQGLAFSFDINQVSDNNYWSDFTNLNVGANSKLIQRVLPTTINLGKGWGTLAAGVNVTQWQTQQGTDSSSAIAAPFDKLPQLTVNYMRADIEGFDWTVNTDLTHFSVNRTFYCTFYSSSAYCNQQNALRMVANNYLSRPFLTSYGYITPKLSISARQYQYEEAYNGTYGKSAASNSDGVVVPTFSLDTGAVMERSMQVFDTNWSQTLEPRGFYVYTPYRYQSDLPNYDTGSNDFNFATVFTENSFSGQDRISDSHTLTLGGTSRMINPESGAEGARFGLAQRYRFTAQNVLLTPDATAVSSGYSDILGGASLYLTPKLTFDSLVQYNYEEGRSERKSYGFRYNPSGYRVINLAYRFQYEASEVVDVSWQWPLNDLWRDIGIDQRQGQGMGSGRWYSVGRLNYSKLDERLVDSLLGFEYDGGCWLARVAAQRTQLTLTTATSSLMFQLEFNDFSKLGLGSMGSVKDNISRYQNLREPFKFAPSPFSQYE
jgi:LPS-assembly protein